MPEEDSTMNLEWKPISEMDRIQSQFVIVTEDGAVRLQYWNSYQNKWEDTRFNTEVDCPNPTHFMECPEPPIGPIESPLQTTT